MGNISRKSKKKLIQKMKATYHEIQLIKIMYTEEALPRYKVPTYCNVLWKKEPSARCC